ncbi:MAG: EamA family transporter [Rhodospirillales bacterium]|nr:EamA family transporter [Alphaproteobacteria bacterium]USO03865.1 MAG: EamA family transporter [Rhodospirillales bacterium]
MSWILLSCIPPFLWACNNLMDEYLAKSTFAGSGALLIYASAVFEIFAAASFYVFVPHVIEVNLFPAFMMMGLGFLLTSSFLPYIYALQEDNAGNAVPIYQTIPVFVFILALVFLGETATFLQAGEALLIVSASIMVGYDFQKKAINKKAVLLMLLASMIIAVFMVLSKFFIVQYSWQIFAFWSWIGSSLGSTFLVLSVPSWRGKALEIARGKSRFVFFIFLIQVLLQSVAMAVWYKAASVGPSVALVQTIGGVQPAFILILSLLAGLFSSSIFPRKALDGPLLFKFVMISFIILGVYLLSL